MLIAGYTQEVSHVNVTHKMKKAEMDRLKTKTDMRGRNDN